MTDIAYPPGALEAYLVTEKRDADKQNLLGKLREVSSNQEFSFNHNYTNNLLEKVLSRQITGKNGEYYHWIIDMKKLNSAWQMVETDVITAATEKILAKRVGIDEYTTFVGVDHETGDWKIVTDTGFDMTESLRKSIENEQLPKFERERALRDYKNMIAELETYKKSYSDTSKSPSYVTFSPTPSSGGDPKKEIEHKKRGYIGMSQMRVGNFDQFEPENYKKIETNSGEVTIIGANHTQVNWGMLDKDRLKDIPDILGIESKNIPEDNLDLFIMEQSGVLPEDRLQELTQLFNDNIEELESAFTAAQAFRQQTLLPFLQEQIRTKIYTRERIMKLANSEDSEEQQRLIAEINNEIMEVIAIMQYRLEEFVKNYLISEQKSALENDSEFRELPYLQQIEIIKQNMDEIIGCGSSEKTSGLGAFGNSGVVGNIMNASRLGVQDQFLKDQYGNLKLEHDNCRLSSVNFFRKIGRLYSCCPLCGKEIPSC